MHRAGFKVAVMGFRNSPAYVQHEMDRILRQFRFTKAHIDDIVISSRTIDEHLEHLTQVLQTFADLNIALKPSKSFLGFPSISLLGIKVW